MEKEKRIRLKEITYYYRTCLDTTKKNQKIEEISTYYLRYIYMGFTRYITLNKLPTIWIIYYLYMILGHNLVFLPSSM